MPRLPASGAPARRLPRLARQAAPGLPGAHALHLLGARPQILATDGLWDIMANEEAADFVERYRGQRDLHVSCAEALTLEAQERWKALHDEVCGGGVGWVGRGGVGGRGVASSSAWSKLKSV